MERENIATLVTKYLAADSSMEEDSILKSELSKTTDPSEYNDLKALFGYFEIQKSHIAIPHFQNPSSPPVHTDRPTGKRGKIVVMPWMAAAASIALIVLAYFYFSQNSLSSSADTYSDPEIAAKNATEALKMLSGEINRGSTLAIDQMKEFDQLNKYLNIF